MEKKKGDENTYVIHPEYKNKFRPGPTKEIIRDVLQSKLDKATYSMETTQLLTKQVADDIKDRLKELMLPRYKIVVQVSIGEQKGQGVRMGTRCFWDGDTDSYASETYSNESLFCVATAYGVYLYWGDLRRLVRLVCWIYCKHCRPAWIALLLSDPIKYYITKKLHCFMRCQSLTECEGR